MKFLESKFYTWGEKLYALIVINTLMLLCAIPVVTLVPALATGIHMVRSLVNEEDEALCQRFMKYFLGILIPGTFSGVVIAGWCLILSYTAILTPTESSLWGMALIGLCIIELMLFAAAILIEYSRVGNRGVTAVTKDALINAHLHLPTNLMCIGLVIFAVLTVYYFKLTLPFFMSGTMFLGYSIQLQLRKKDEYHDSIQ